MALEWSDKIDGIDVVLADDINSIAHEAILQNEKIGELETRTANNESGIAEAKGRLGVVESMYGDLVAEIDEINGQVSGCRSDINNMVPILHNASVAVDELKDSKADKSSTYTKTDIDSKMGDIETALDSIIAIQNSLIGGDSV